MSSGLTTLEITARSRQSLTEYSVSNKDGKDQQIEMMTEYLFQHQQQRELEELK